MARYQPWLRMYHGYRDRDAAIADFQSNTTRATVSPSRGARVLGTEILYILRKGGRPLNFQCLRSVQSASSRVDEIGAIGEPCCAHVRLRSVHGWMLVGGRGDSI